MCVALAVLVVPALAGSLKDVPVGGNVFIGEQGLNLTGIASGTSLSYYTGTQTPGVSAPAATVNVGNAASFYVAPADFVGRTGNWYVGTGLPAVVGIVVNDPVQTISVYDQQSLKDVTGKSIPAGDFLVFRIETNMNVIPSERQTTAGFMTIKVKTSDGTVYTALQQSVTVQQTLLNQAPNAMPYMWNSIPLNGQNLGWGTGVLSTEGSRLYKAGGYTFTIEAALNGMKDNYKDASGNDYTGKTISAVKTVTIASDTVKIEASKDSVVRGNPFAVTITGKPNTPYYLWVKGTSSMSGAALDQPPSIVLSQDNVKMDAVTGPWPIGQYVYQGSTKTIQSDVPVFYGVTNVSGTYYYASVTLSNSGTRTVGFSTNKDTKDKKYTIRVERPEPYANTGDDRQFKSDEVDVKVEKGAVTIVAAGTQNYFLGEEVKFTGTNSETDFTYLFITGPNLPGPGGKMTDPREPVINGFSPSFSPSDVLEDNTWEYKWQTSNLNIDAGTYTVYAVATPSSKDFLSNAQYATVSVIIRKPFISAQASQSVVAQGDKLFIRGTAAGQPTQGIAVWVLGKNKVIFSTTSVNADGTFEYEVAQGVTSNMAAGQYFVVAQHPMYNEIFDVYPNNAPVVVSGQTYAAYDLVEGSYPVVNNVLFKLQGAGSLQGSDAAEALVQALNNPSVDDTYAKLQFLVEIAKVTVLPVGEKQVGDKFTIVGTTNLAVDDELLVEVTSSSFKPTQKTQSGEFSGSTGTVKVQKGTDGMNKWSFPVDAAAFKPDEYIVQASSITVSNAQASTLFNVVEFKPTPVPTTVVTTAPVVSAVTTAPVPVTTVPTAKPTTQPGFGALVALIGLGAVAFLVVRKH
jgi:PGF-CTERM protein